MLAHTCIGLQHRICSVHMPPSRARRPAAPPHRRPCTPLRASQRERPATTSRSCTAYTRTASRAKKRPHVCHSALMASHAWHILRAHCRCCCSPPLAPRSRCTLGTPRKCPVHMGAHTHAVACGVHLADNARELMAIVRMRMHDSCLVV